MSYDQGAGPSTPGRSFASFARPSDMLNPQQQRIPSGGNASSSSGFGQNVNITRSSSMRSIPTAQSSTASNFGFGGMREVSATPKTVRWEGAPSTPIQEQPVSSMYPQNHLGQQQNFNLQQHSLHNQSQTQYHDSSSQNQAQYRESNFQPYSSQSRNTSLQMQHSPPSQQYSSFSNSFSSPLSLSTSNKLQEPSTPASAVRSTHSGFNLAIGKKTAVSNISPLKQSVRVPTQSTKIPSVNTKAPIVVISRPALVSRIRWNVIVVLSCWIAPRIGPVGRMYWILLDLSFAMFGGDADVYVATGLSWLRTASFVILCGNILEACILLNTQSNNLEVDTSTSSPTKRKPSLAFPPGRLVSSPMQPTSSSPTPSVSKRNTPRQYAHNSPLRESIFRASASAQGIGEGRRLPSQTPRMESNIRKGSSASPLAAFLARKQERIASGGDVTDMSFDGEAGERAYRGLSENVMPKQSFADLSVDSIEVDRALRAFSADYEREVSQSRPSGSNESQPTAIAV